VLLVDWVYIIMKYTLKVIVGTYIWGVAEQGGKNSIKFYKISNNEQLSTAQASGLGTSVMDNVVADIGQADGDALLSDEITQLQLLLQLTLSYCQKYQVTLFALKTNLLVISKSPSDLLSCSITRAVSMMYYGMITCFVFTEIDIEN
jgi:hypothetical protein